MGTGGDFQIGKLRERISFQRPEQSSEPSTGESIRTWQTVATNVPAGFSETQTEVESGRKNSRSSAATFVVRHMQVETTWRILFGDRKFEISGSVDVDGRKRFVTINAMEVK